MGLLAHKFVALIRCVVKVHVVVVPESIEPIDETAAPFYDVVGLVRPVKVVARRAGEKVEEP
jgi:hypothetical protein